MAKIHTDSTYTNDEIADVADDELAKSLVHGAELQSGQNRRRDHSLSERIKLRQMLRDEAQAAEGAALVRQSVIFVGRRG